MPIPPGELAPAAVYPGVDDLPEACGQVECAGGRLLSPASPRVWDDTVAYYADPDGHVLALAGEP